MKNSQKSKSKEYNSKEFLLEFFKDSNIEDKNNILKISNVPEDFEKFIGKKSPYTFVFDIPNHNKIKDSELIMQGSYFLLAIRDYLSDKGETSLLKINTQPNLSNKTLKKYKITNIEQDSSSNLYELSFISIYQYLNDKKQSTHKILIKDKEVLSLDITKFKITKSNKIENLSLDPEISYNFAKSIIDKKVKEEIKSIKVILREKLNKELFRVKDHYHKQIKEKDEEVESCANKIKLLNSKLRHTSYERDRSILRRLIRESEERLEMLKKRSYKERLKSEELFHINDEIEKHALSIKNSLINITIYNYPIYKLILRDKKALIYDPILDKIL